LLEKNSGILLTSVVTLLSVYDTFIEKTAYSLSNVV